MIGKSLRREIEQRIKELRQEQRELSIIDDDRKYWKLAGEVRSLKWVLGVRSAKDRWMFRDNGGFGRNKTARCGYCGGTIVDQSSSHPAVIWVKCRSCGFEDERDVS